MLTSHGKRTATAESPYIYAFLALGQTYQPKISFLSFSASFFFNAADWRSRELPPWRSSAEIMIKYIEYVNIHRDQIENGSLGCIVALW